MSFNYNICRILEENSFAERDTQKSQSIMKYILLSGIAAGILVLFDVKECYSQSIDGLEQCITSHKVEGCSIPFNTSFPYKRVFNPACSRHKVCYQCVSQATYVDVWLSIANYVLKRIKYGC